MEINKVLIKFKEGDITEIKTDALVNPANTSLKMGGGLALAIKKKAGSDVEREALNFAPIQKGEAILTSGGKLKAKFIIHTATMAMDFKTDQKIIRRAIKSSLELARLKKLKTLAIPALGCGSGKFPIKEAAKIMAEEVINYIYSGVKLKKIIFVLHTKNAYKEFRESFNSHTSYILRKISSIPIPTVDAIIQMPKDKIILIQRKNPPFGWALPGGFVEYNESLEDCLKREVEEETGLKVTELEQFHTYSKPDRDPRFHTISTVFIVKAKGKPQAKSDAKALKIFKLNNLPLPEEFAFDHWQIIQDWLSS